MLLGCFLTFGTNLVSADENIIPNSNNQPVGISDKVMSKTSTETVTLSSNSLEVVPTSKLQNLGINNVESPVLHLKILHLILLPRVLLR